MKLNRTIVTSLVAVLSLSATFAYAIMIQPFQITYYDSKGKAVGGKTLSCDGKFSSWGKVTAKMYTETLHCKS
ncbi:DUF6289 family protein [Undibacterium fentianense]|uniref:DUF6289 family protein n=1 Tax=Undibacterium fentianense TaxID=2828728 RepID=UPI0034DCD001